MNENPPSSRPGLAIVVLTMGIASLVSSFLLVGVLPGLLGLLLGLGYLWRYRSHPRGMVAAGMVLAAAGVLASAGFGALYYAVFRTFEAARTGAAFRAWEGVEAPDFTVTTLAGETLTLSELEGRRVLVDFWATWCGPCVGEAPHFNRLREEVSEEELVMIGISSEEPAMIQPFLEEHGIEYHSVSTDELPAPYSSVHAIPTTFFIDRQGVIQTVVTGYREFEVLEGYALGEDYAGEARREPGSTAP